MNWFKKLTWKLHTHNFTIVSVNVRLHDDQGTVIELKTEEGVDIKFCFSRRNALILSRLIEGLYIKKYDH